MDAILIFTVAMLGGLAIVCANSHQLARWTRSIKPFQRLAEKISEGDEKSCYAILLAIISAPNAIVIGNTLEWLECSTPTIRIVLALITLFGMMAMSLLRLMALGMKLPEQRKEEEG